MPEITVSAIIITIGDELLIGQTIDTNSAWMAQKLNAIGIAVIRRVAVGDDRVAILAALREEGEKADIILVTGGLGPTSDDITKMVMAEYFGGGLVMNETALENVEKFFASRGLTLSEVNRQQALLPASCEPLTNRRGTAPGMWFRKDGKIYVSMPGVPNEMKGMMNEEVLPRLQRELTLPVILHKTLVTVGMGESFVAERLKAFEAQLPSNIKLAYLPGYALLKLRLSGRAGNGGGPEPVEAQFEKMKSLLADITAAEEDVGLEQVIGRLLKERDQTVSTAESCTGGFIAHLITSIPGSSVYFKGSVVSYSNAIKTGVLKVKEDTLAGHGAVSRETVEEMITGVLTLMQTDYAVAVSGIMGPDGGTPEKPVGTVWIAVGNGENMVTRKYQLRHDRERNIGMTATYALNMLRIFILESGRAGR